MGPKKRKKKDDMAPKSGAESSSEDGSEYDEENIFKPYRVPNYIRQYSVDSGNIDFIVFYESANREKPISDRDLMTLGNILKRNNKGIKQFKRINKYKIGAIFERPAMANAALNNMSFLKDQDLIATIPAASTEVTGVIRSVPCYLSNSKIYKALSSYKSVVSVRRFMKRVRDGNKTDLEPTQSVAITFACSQLPDSVDLNSWRFEVSPYLPPVKQCLKCLRYGHIAKFCKNAQKCSVCTESHSYKECTKDIKEAICCNCNGNHIAISSQCPIKKKKIEEMKIKTRTVPYSELFNEKSFPTLGSKPTLQLESLFNSEQFMSIIISTITKLITMKTVDNNKTPICSSSIKSTLLETLKNKNNKQNNNGPDKNNSMER